MHKCIFLIVFLSYTIFTCSENRMEQVGTSPLKWVDSLEVPINEIDKSELIYDRLQSIWMLDGMPYSGQAISQYDEGTLKEKTGFLNGKKQNESIHYYPDGNHKSISNYHLGKLHGDKKTWLSDSTHVLVSHLHYHLGKVHGKQMKWYPTGELFKVLHLNMGKEEGIQQAYRKNGVLYANYEAREGRIFGLRKAALCYGLEDENIQYEN